MSKNRGTNKRKGSKPLRTKRTMRNAKKWEKKTGYANREMQHRLYCKHKL